MIKYRKISLVALLALLTIYVSDVYAKTIYVLEFNDFHGMLYHNIIDDRTVPGAIYFMNAILKEQKKDDINGKAVVVCGGDNYQGTIVSYETKGLPDNEMFKSIGVKVSAIGNHDFDWGQENFAKWQEEGGFTFVAANVIDIKTQKTPSWCTPYEIIRVDGVKIAFIGLATLDTVVTTSAKNLNGLKITDPWTAAQYWIDFLKEGKDPQGKPDVIIALTHIPSSQSADGKIEGDEINHLCDKTKGLDAVLSGHSHLTVCGTINNIPVIQAQCYGEKYGILKINIDDETGKLISIQPEVCAVPSEGEILPENNGSKILVKYDGIEKKYSRVLGTTKGVPYDPLTLSPLGVYMTKLMAESTRSQIAIVNPFGIRGGLDKGNITVGDMFRISPFNNTLVTMKLTGAQLKKVMEYGLSGKAGCVQFYGLNIEFDSSKPIGERIISMELPDGKAIEIDKSYTLCTNDFMFTGGDGYDFSGAEDVKTHNDIFVRDLMIKGIEEEKTLNLPPVLELRDITKEENKQAA